MDNNLRNTGGNMNIYKIYDNRELVAIEDNLTTVRQMARLTAEETSKLFRKGRITTNRFQVTKY